LRLPYSSQQPPAGNSLHKQSNIQQSEDGSNTPV
jgi:hypothetical protein